MRQFDPNNWPFMRLPPSGPFIRNPTSNVPINYGPGATGLIIRAQGTSGTAVQAASGGDVGVTGLYNVPVNMPKGHLYDVAVGVAVTLPAGNADVGDALQATLWYSDDNGGTWQKFPDADSPSGVPRMYAPLNTKGSDFHVFREVAVNTTDSTKFPNDITNLRLTVKSAGGTPYIQPGLTWVRVEQYVPAPVPT
jgi:hypothetical protein